MATAEQLPVDPLEASGDIEPDEELDEFLAWLYAERHRDADLSRQRPDDYDDPDVWRPEEWP